MKYLAAAFIAAVFAGQLSAQAPAAKKVAAPEKSEAAAAEKKDAKPEPAKAAVAPKVAAAPKPAPKPAARQAEEPEEAMVMIDDRAEPAEGARPETGAFAAEQEAVPGGLPAAYGQLRGALTDAGRQILVFESLDDGEITFVQVTLGKTGVTWRRLDSIRRSGGEIVFN